MGFDTEVNVLTAVATLKKTLQMSFRTAWALSTWRHVPETFPVLLIFDIRLKIFPALKPWGVCN